MNALGGRAGRIAAAALALTLIGVDPGIASEPAPLPEASGLGEGEGLSGDAPVEKNALAEIGAKAFDVFPLRALTVGATVIGFGAFVVSVPLVAPYGRLEAIRESWDYFVMGPVDYTFVRPLGDF